MSIQARVRTRTFSSRCRFCLLKEVSNWSCRHSRSTSERQTHVGQQVADFGEVIANVAEEEVDKVTAPGVKPPREAAHESIEKSQGFGACKKGKPGQPVCQRRAHGCRGRTFKGKANGQVERLGTLNDKVDERLQSAGIALVDCR